MSLTPDQVKLYEGILVKLNQVIEGTEDFKPGPIINQHAPCLVRSVIYDLIMFNHSLGN